MACDAKLSRWRGVRMLTLDSLEHQAVLYLVLKFFAKPCKRFEFKVWICPCRTPPFPVQLRNRLPKLRRAGPGQTSSWTKGRLENCLTYRTAARQLDIYARETVSTFMQTSPPKPSFWVPGEFWKIPPAAFRVNPWLDIPLKPMLLKLDINNQTAFAFSICVLLSRDFQVSLLLPVKAWCKSSLLLAGVSSSLKMFAESSYEWQHNFWMLCADSWCCFQIRRHMLAWSTLGWQSLFLYKCFNASLNTLPLP